MEKKRTAQEAYDSTKDTIAGLKKDYEDATKARKEQAKYIKDEANVEVDEFDPTKGKAPEPPKEATN